MISVLIPTKNEERNLRGCLESVAWSDDIHVYDSGSTDATAAVARSAGVNFLVRVPGGGQELFGGNESEHKNWALANVRFKYEWVLHLDADERVTPELVTNIQQVVRDPKDKVAFRVTRRDFWGKHWLKHVTASPFNIRLFRPEKLRYERLVNPVSIPLGPVGDVIGYFDHYPFNKGIRHWLAKHNSYSSLEAKQIAQDLVADQRFSMREIFLTKDRNVRRFYQKKLFYRLPARPVLKFLLLYLGKRGFLDGGPGFRYAMLQSFYEYMIVLKTNELGKKPVAIAAVTRGESIPGVPR